jgi:hypothetical protein
MAHVIDGVALDVERLNQRVRELESRVSTLESRQEVRQEDSTNAPSESPDLALQRPRPPATWRGFPVAEFPGGAVPVLGKAVLGIAGAYLLRAIAESSSVPKLPILFVAIVYAALWMVWAVRTHTANRFASITYAITSALILSPLLWESTVRFQTLSPTYTAVVLVAFTVLALALSWRLDLQLIPWIATLATVLTAVALIIQTHELVPLTAALLAVALATEIAACLEHRLTLRAVPALAADFVVWLLVFVMTSPDGAPEGYPPASPAILTALCLLLFAIYGTSIAIRTFARRHPITLFEIAQGILAFVLAAFGALRATHTSAAPAFGVFALLLAAVCYWGALSRFAAESHVRNRRTSATYAAALLLIGSYLLLSPTLLVPFLSLAAVASAFLYARTDKLSLGMHASFYLAAATATSTLPNWIVAALAGTLPTYPDSSVWIVAVSSALCYILGSWGTQADQSHTKRRMLWVVPAVLVSFASAAVAIVAIAGLAASRLDLTPSRLSVVRTIVNCALALVLAFLGSRWKHIELSWVAYAAVAFGTLKLIFEDLRFGNASSLVVSLLFYGLVLILLPRITRRSESPVGF